MSPPARVTCSPIAAERKRHFPAGAKSASRLRRPHGTPARAVWGQVAGDRGLPYPLKEILQMRFAGGPPRRFPPTLPYDRIWQHCLGKSRVAPYLAAPAV